MKFFRLAVALGCLGVAVAGAETKTALPAPDPAFKDYVPSFSPNYRGGKAFQAPNKNGAAPAKPTNGMARPTVPAPKPAQPPAAKKSLPVPGRALPAAPIAAPAGATLQPAPATPTPLPATPLPKSAPTTTPGFAKPTPMPTAPKAVAPKAEPTPTTAPTPDAPDAETAMPEPSEPAATSPKPEGAPAEKPGEKVAEKPAVPVLGENPASKSGSSSTKTDEYHKQYKEFFSTNEFTGDFAEYWTKAFADEPERRADLIQESAAVSAEALAAAWSGDAPALASIGNALAWLDQLYAGVDETTWKSVGEALTAAFAGQPLDLVRALDEPTDPNVTRTAMQTCLTLALYGDQAALRRWLALPERTRSFLEDGQAFLFGGAVLTPEQYDSLASLFKAVPRELHQVLAVIIPEGARMEAADAGLVTGGLVLNIYASPVGMTSPDEFFAELGAQPVAPVFTIEAAAQLVRAVQYVQFSLRPELAQRRDLILQNAGTEPTRYLRHNISPAAILSSPDELLPQTAYLWFIDSGLAFQQAGGMLRFKEGQAMDAVLLLTDLLSGGQESGLAFRTGMDGRVLASRAPLQRMEVMPGVVFSTGIGVGPELWSFGIDAKGSVTREGGPMAVATP